MIRLLMTIFGIGTRLLQLQVMSGFQPPSAAPSTEGKASNAAMLTLGAGIASWFMLPFIAGVVGTIIGWSELSKIKRGESPMAGKSITQLGLLLSVANVAFTILGGCAMAVFYFGLFAMLFGGSAVMMEQIPELAQ